MKTINLDKNEVDVLISSLMLLSKKDELKIEELYKVRVNQLFNKLYTLEDKFNGIL